jgi:hypothetical protein
VQAWLIDEFQQGHPGVNVTAMLRFGTMISAYILDSGGIGGGGSGASSAEGNDVAKSAELEVAMGLLPYSKQLLGNLSSGNLFAAMALVPASFAELRAAIAAQGADAVVAEHMKFVGTGVGRASAFLAHYILAFVSGLLWFIAAGFSVLLQFLIFCSALYYLLVSRASVIDTLGDSLTSLLGTDELVVSIGRSINAVFASTTKLFFFHALSTGLLFQCFGVNLVVLSAILSGLSAAFPFVSTLLIPILAVPQLLLQARYVALAVIVFVHLFIWWTVDTAIYAEIPGSHTLAAGLSVVLGISAFGLHGVLIGPIMVCIPVIVIDFWSKASA